MLTPAPTATAIDWTFGDVLRKARTSTGLTQAEFGERIGRTRYSIAIYESGRRVPPHPVLIAWEHETGLPAGTLTDAALADERVSVAEAAR